jgi:predicted ATPase
LRGCRPGVALLATSREPIRIDGEHIFRVAPLDVPANGSSFCAIVTSDAVQLFAERVRSLEPAFQIDDANSEHVSAICRRLDGIPLAIELAAARVPLMSLRDISQRLRDRFGLLTTGPRTAATRQQTLRALVDWSYQLLDPREQLALCRLSVFAGGCTIEAAEAVLRHGDIDASEVPSLLVALSEKSLLVSDPLPELTRYTMLETIRDFAAHRGDALTFVNAVRCRRSGNGCRALPIRSRRRLDAPARSALQ